MPSARYYREQAETLLCWARAANDKAYAARLRTPAAEEFEQAETAREAITDLNPLLMEFNAQRLNSALHQVTRMARPEPVRHLQDLLAFVGSPDEIAPVDTAHFARGLGDVITGACTSRPSGRSETVDAKLDQAASWLPSRPRL